MEAVKYGQVRAATGADVLSPDTLIIEQADPTALIDDHLLDLIKAGLAPHVSVTGDLLRINASNGRWIYRIEGPADDGHSWVLRWPD